MEMPEVFLKNPDFAARRKAQKYKLALSPTSAGAGGRLPAAKGAISSARRSGRSAEFSQPFSSAGAVRRALLLAPSAAAAIAPLRSERAGSRRGPATGSGFKQLR